jgi:uncharacterized protein YihD (DUF1040 family)
MSEHQTQGWTDRGIDQNPPKCLHDKLIALAHEASSLDAELSIAVFLLKRARASQHEGFPEDLDDEIVNFINKHGGQPTPKT